MKLHYLILIALLLCSSVYAQKTSTSYRELSTTERSDLLKFRESVWRDYFAGNRAGLEKALPEKFVGIGWNGAGEGGDERFSDLKNVIADAEGFAKAGGKLTRLVFPITKIQAYGDFVVFYITYELDLEINGKTTTYKGHGTEFFVKENGKWIHPGWHLDNY